MGGGKEARDGGGGIPGRGRDHLWVVLFATLDVMNLGNSTPPGSSVRCNSVLLGWIGTALVERKAVSPRNCYVRSFLATVQTSPQYTYTIFLSTTSVSSLYQTFSHLINHM